MSDTIATSLAWLFGAALLGLIVERILYALLRRWAQRDSMVAAAIVRQTARPAAYIAPLVGLLLALPYSRLPAVWAGTVEHIAELLTIAALAWSIIALIRLVSDLAIAQRPLDGEGVTAGRRFSTRIDILGRTAVLVVVVIALGSMLMTFPPIRAFGTTLLASAGVAGLVVGLAARPLFENLVAGVQLALTQPIRLNDAVVVEKQYGRIEEIHTTFVVVRLIDLRRMIVPLTYFINTPFENWSRRSGGLIGDVMVFADYGFDVGALRKALPSILRGSPLWDGETAKVEVNATTDRAMQLRIVLSARNGEELLELKAYALEAILAYIAEHHAESYPRGRNETLAVSEKTQPNG